MSSTIVIDVCEKVAGMDHNFEISNCFRNFEIHSIPKSLFQLKDKLIAFSIYNNYFEENIPTEFGTMEKLEELSLANNLFNGTIPKELGSMSNLSK